MTRVLSGSVLDGADVVDVLVVGSGAAGSMAALKAKWAAPSARVVVIEKGASAGGTTAKSGGTFWIPNNPLMCQQGLADDRGKLLEWMAMRSFGKELGGCTTTQRGWLENYYDLGAKMCSELREKGAMPLTQPRFFGGGLVYDYNHWDQNPQKRGRMVGAGMPAWQRLLIHSFRIVSRFLAPLRSKFPFVKELLNLSEFKLDITYGIGLTLVARFQAALKAARVECRLQQSVDAVVEDQSGAVIGARVRTHQGVRFVAAKAVIFATGGFSNNPELRAKYLGSQSKAIDGTAACAGNVGDFLRISEDLKLDLVNMDKIWGSQCYAEQSADTFETPGCLFQFRGDSAILVNGNGVRVMNEKKPYDLRVRHHWEAPENRLMILVADRRAVDLYGNNFIAMTLPGDPASPLYIKGDSPADLTARLRPRVAALSKKLCVDYSLAPAFEENLAATIARFNGFAEVGVDHDFSRGGTDYENQWQFVHASSARNCCMHPIDITKLYAVIIGPQSADTKGGPAIDLHARCLRKGAAVPGLYACGNASGAISGDAYWSGGAAIGSAMITGYVAGLHAASLVNA